MRGGMTSSWLQWQHMRGGAPQTAMQRQAERLAGGALPRELATMMYNDTYFPTQWAAGDELLAPGVESRLEP